MSQQAQAPVLPIGFGGIKGALDEMFRLKRPRLSMNVGELIPPVARVPEWPGGLWTHFKNCVGHRPTWRGIVYLFLRFPVGVATFTVAVTLVSTSVAMTLAPSTMTPFSSAMTLAVREYRTALPAIVQNRPSAFARSRSMSSGVSRSS